MPSLQPKPSRKPLDRSRLTAQKANQKGGEEKKGEHGGGHGRWGRRRRRANRNQKSFEEDVVPDEQQERRTSEGNRHHDPQVSKNSPNCSPTSLFTSHMNKSGEEISSSTKRDRSTSAVILGNYINFGINYIDIIMEITLKTLKLFRNGKNTV